MSDLMIDQTHYHYSIDILIPPRIESGSPSRRAEPSLSPSSLYLTLYTTNHRLDLPLLLVPSLTPQLPLVIHHGLTLLSFLWHGNSSLGHLLLLEHVALREWVAGTESARVGLMGSMSSLGGSGLDRPVE